MDDVIWGASTQRGKQGLDRGRMAALDAGYDVRASGVTLDRFSGSGITSVNLAAAARRRKSKREACSRLATPRSVLPQNWVSLSPRVVTAPLRTAAHRAPECGSTCSA